VPGSDAPHPIKIERGGGRKGLGPGKKIGEGSTQYSLNRNDRIGELYIYQTEDGEERILRHRGPSRRRYLARKGQ
jgi:hypothetical protein